MEHKDQFYFTYAGQRFHVRPVTQLDRNLFQRGYHELSEKSRYLRFFAVRSKLSDAQLDYLTKVDGINHVAWGILDESETEPKPVAVGRFVKLNQEPDVAELAITVVDAYQKKGLARILYAALNIVAARVGVKAFRGYVLEENMYVLEILRHFNLLQKREKDHLVIVDIPVFPNHQTIPRIPEMKRLAATMENIERAMGGTSFSL
jgi:GNAT superfamily N-acetyltransferase